MILGQTSSLLTSMSKNNTDTHGVDNFLDSYNKEKMESATNLGYNTLTALDLNEKKEVDKYDNKDFSDIFHTLNIKLECDDDCVKDANSMIEINVPLLDSYIAFETIGTQKFSILDVFSNSFKTEVQKIKYILESIYPMILINTYKYKMMADFYYVMKLKQNRYDIIHKIILLTLMSIVDDIESCDGTTITKADIEIILENLKSPPSLEFCKQWMKMHEFACIIENTIDKKCILYNYSDYKPCVYIYFEFYTKMLVLLKSVRLTVQQ